METIKQDISAFAKTNRPPRVENMSLWKRLKLRFSAKSRRKHGRRTACNELLNHALFDIDSAMLQISEIQNKI